MKNQNLVAVVSALLKLKVGEELHVVRATEREAERMRGRLYVVLNGLKKKLDFKISIIDLGVMNKITIERVEQEETELVMVKKGQK